MVLRVRRLILMVVLVGGCWVMVVRAGAARLPGLLVVLVVRRSGCWVPVVRVVLAVRVLRVVLVAVVVGCSVLVAPVVLAALV